MENSMAVPKKVKIDLPYDPAVPLLGIYLKELKSGSWRDICIFIFMSTLVTIAKRWKQPKCPLTDEWINKMWSIHTMQYYSTLKRKEILTHATTWIKVEDIMLSEWASHKKTNIVWFPLYEVPGVVKFIGTGSRMVAARGWGRGRLESCLNGIVF